MGLLQPINPHIEIFHINFNLCCIVSTKRLVFNKDDNLTVLLEMWFLRPQIHTNFECASYSQHTRVPNEALVPISGNYLSYGLLQSLSDS